MTEQSNQSEETCKILLADDDLMFRIMLRRFFERHNYQVIEAEDGQQAIELFKREHISLVLLDADMPVLNGFATCAKILSLNADIPILIITANNDHGFIDKTFAAGAADYIHKPIHWQLLLHRINYLLRTFKEIAERKKRALEMRKLTSALAQAGSSVIITDLNGRIEYVNQAFSNVTGYTAEEVIGKNPKVLQSGLQHNDFYKQLWHSLLEHGEWQGNLKNRRKDGSLYSERLHIRALHDENGLRVNYVGVFSDITEQLAMEEQYRQSQKMAAVGTLVGGVAHNFNNMLAGIVGRADMINMYCAGMVETSDTKDNVIESAQIIGNIGMRASEMIQQLLAFARKGIKRRSSVDLNNLCQQAFTVATMSLPENIIAKISLPNDILVTHADGNQLQQVVINLVNNARDAVCEQDKPRINVSLQYREIKESNLNFHIQHPDITAKKFALFCVKDNGMGIPKETLNKIFDPFFTTKEVGSGTGLGLSMALGVAEDHGGALEVESNVGIGSTFHFWIALSEAPTIEQKSIDDIENNKLVEKQKKQNVVLLADDDKIIHDTTGKLLELMGIKVLPAYDGYEALQLFKQYSKEIDLVISDVVMPKMYGTEAISKMRSICPKLPTIFITGYDKSEVQIAAQYQDITYVVSKPFKLSVLRQLIQEMLRLATP